MGINNYNKTLEIRVPINWEPNWNEPGNTIPAYTTRESIVGVFQTAQNTNDDRIDAGLKEALVMNSAAGVAGSAAAAEILTVKGIHDHDNHITVDYCGGRWHLVCIPIAAGYRIYSASQ